MLALPPVAPATGWRAATRLARDHYVRLDGNDYSVHPGVIGHRVEVVADLHRFECSAGAGRWPTTRAVTIAAPAEAVWPWLVQMVRPRRLVRLRLAGSSRSHR